jgi:hypothetical protein
MQRSVPAGNSASIGPWTPSYERERDAGELEAFVVNEPDFQNVDEAIDALMGRVPEAAMQLRCEKTLRIAVYSVTFTTTIRMGAMNLRRLQGLQLEISVYPTSA